MQPESPGAARGRAPLDSLLTDEKLPSLPAGRAVVRADADAGDAADTTCEIRARSARQRKPEAQHYAGGTLERETEPFGAGLELEHVRRLARPRGHRLDRGDQDNDRQCCRSYRDPGDDVERRHAISTTRRSPQVRRICRRTRRAPSDVFTVSMLRCLVLLLVVLASGCQAGDNTAGPVPSAAPEAHFVGADGVRLEVPAGWYVSPTGSSSLVDPVVRLAVSSGPIRPQESDCQATSFTVAEDAVAIVVLEWTRVDTPLPVRRRAFDARVLPLASGAVECFEGRGGGTQFVDSGRAFGTFILRGDDAPPALVERARAVLNTLLVDPALPASVELVALAPERLEHCRRSTLLRTICPTFVPRVRAPYLSHLARDPARASGDLHSFDLERGGEYPDHPERNRPPRMAHIVLVAGDTERIAPWREPWTEPARPLRDGVLAEDREQPVSFGHFDVGETRALVFLAPPYPTGGYLGNHLVLTWKAQRGRRAVSLHAWEPLTEAVATLRRIALSASNVAGGARLSARSDADGVLFVDGGGWRCQGKVSVDLPQPWAGTKVQPINDGEFHLTYARPTVKPYSGTVTARQQCGRGDALRARTTIIVGERR